MEKFVYSVYGIAFMGKFLKKLTIAAFSVVFTAFGLAFAPSASASELLDIRLGPQPGKTRIVFDLKGEPAYVVSGAIADNSADKGRVVVDFEDLSTGAGAFKEGAGAGHVKSYQLHRKGAGDVRAVFAFKKTAAISQIFVIKPTGSVKKYRLVIDLKTSDRAGFLASLPSIYPDLSGVIEQATADSLNAKESVKTQPATQREVKREAEPKRSAKRYTIVIDAGHGGMDPGATGQQGTLEKTVTLAAAKTLRTILLKRKRYNVVMTREADVKVGLASREPIAREAGADLFISLHADALASNAVRGGSVYTLSEQGTKRSADLAKSSGNYRVYDLEVGDFGEEVGEILFDLAQGRTNNASGQFASALLGHLKGVTPLLNRSHREADLRVLLAPDVPAVLFEMGYMSNAKDEANLTSKKWRNKTMTAVADAIDKYFLDTEAREFAAN